MGNEKCVQIFCKNIRYLRVSRGLTQKQMAQVIGISVGTLRRIERGDRSFRFHGEHLCALCDAFDISADRLVYSVLKNE